MKILSLREEDHQLLLHLHDFIYLPVDFVTGHIFKSYTNHHSVYRRLRDLEEAGYIKHWFLQIKDEDVRSQKVFTLTRFGVDNVEQLGRVVHWNNDWTNKPAIWYKHAIMIAETVKQFEVQAPNSSLVMKEFITEPRASYNFPVTAASTKKMTSIRPDGIVVLGPENNNSGHAFFLEMERSYSTKERTLRKIEQFNEFFSRRNELLDDYKRKVAFSADVALNFKIIFIGGTPAKAEKLIRDLQGETSLLPVLVADVASVNYNPLGQIYRNINNPEIYTSL